MKTLRNLILSILGIIILIPLLTISYCYFDEVRPMQERINSIITNAHVEDAKPPDNIIHFIKVSHGELFGFSTWSNWVARQLEHTLNIKEIRSLNRVISVTSWWVLLNVSYSESELLTIYCSLSYSTKETGLNNISKELFNKPLSKLSDNEAATVVALLFAPSIFIKDLEKLNNRRDHLLTIAAKKT